MTIQLKISKRYLTILKTLNLEIKKKKIATEISLSVTGI